MKKIENELIKLEFKRQDLINEQISVDLTIGLQIDAVDNKIEKLNKELIKFEKSQTTLNHGKQRCEK